MHVLAILATIVAGPGGNDATGEPGPPRAGAGVRCAANPSLPVCSLARGDVVQHTLGRIGFMPDAWADVSATLKRLRDNLDSWPAHCENLRTADRTMWHAKVDASDAECTDRLDATAAAMKAIERRAMLRRWLTAGLAVLGAAGGVWCAVDDQPGNWPCWSGGGAGLSAALVVLFM